MALPNAAKPADEVAETTDSMVTLTLPIDVLNSFIDVLTEARDQAQGAPEETAETEEEKKTETGFEGMGEEMSKSVRPPMQTMMR